MNVTEVLFPKFGSAIKKPSGKDIYLSTMISNIRHITCPCLKVRHQRDSHLTPNSTTHQMATVMQQKKEKYKQCYSKYKKIKSHVSRIFIFTILISFW